MSDPSKRLIYPARRAVEHVTTIPELRPLRLFAVLWPLWHVETAAEVREEQSYEMIDRFLTRGIIDARLSTSADLARFFALPPTLVERCLSYLAVIDHIRVSDGRIAVTELGRESARAGVRLVRKESRQPVLLDKFTAQPLPQAYYQGSVGLLDEPRIGPEQAGDNSTFFALFAPTAFHDGLVTDLEHRPDRADINLPRQLAGLRVLTHRDAYLPGYLIETADGRLVAYSSVSESRDPFLEQACAATPRIHQLVAAEPGVDPEELWTRWLADGHHRGTLRRLPSGVWRATLDPAEFGTKPLLSIMSIGSFRLRKRHFLQLWSNDPLQRAHALAQRMTALARNRDVSSWDMLSERAAPIADLLEVDLPTLEQVTAYATRQADENLLRVLSS